MNSEIFKSLTMVLSVVGKIIDKTPDYDQKKKQRYFYLRSLLNLVSKMPDGKGQDDLIPNLIEDIELFSNTFFKEIDTRITIK